MSSAGWRRNRTKDPANGPFGPWRLNVVHGKVAQTAREIRHIASVDVPAWGLYGQKGGLRG
jgi:hypothetical protein